jgi:formylglycine-generating enzyme required for sulfatase activity
MNVVNNALIVCLVFASEVLSFQPTPANAADEQATAAITHLGEMITIPAGNFIMGNNNGAPEEKPEHSVYLPTYQIGKYEVTRGEYRKFIEAGGYNEPKYWSDEGWKWKESDELIFSGMNGHVNKEKRPASMGKRSEPLFWAAEQEWAGDGGVALSRFAQTDKHPVVAVTHYEAEAYCKWAGGRLPTEAEYEKAARWDEKQQHSNIWPWGDVWDAEKSNNADDHNPAGGGVKRGQSAPVGSYPAGASPYGCMDMVGNAYEWCGDWAKSYPGNTDVYDYTGKYYIVKGGCWDDGGSSAAGRSWWLPPGSSGSGSLTGKGDSDHIGFRLAR